MLFKRALLAASAAALLIIPAVSYAQNNPPPSANSEQKGRPGDRDRDRGVRDRTTAPAAARDQSRDRATRRIPQERAARTAPGGQKGPTSGSQATQERAARTPSGQVGPQGAPTGPATRERAARTTPRGQAVQRPSGVATRERAPAPPPNVQYQNRYQDLRNNPAYRVATPRWTRGDRLPDQYRQSRYFVNDWRARRLRPPPRGYRWVRDDFNNYYLLLIATGMISQALYRDSYDDLWRRRYSRLYTYEDDIYYRDCRRGPDPAGVIVGALIGGLLGNAVGYDDGRAGTTVAGVILGGALGAALTRDLDCEDRSYAYRAYYDGFNAGRPNAFYQWRNPRSGHYGDFRVEDYFYDPDGFRCANYSQRIYIGGMPETATGHACEQPDGTWAMVS